MLTHLVRFSLLLTVCVIALGAYTRLADAGLGCPDWPGCYGQLSVPSTLADIQQANEHFPQLTVEAEKAWLEMIHRYFAGSLGLVVFCISVVGWRTQKVSKSLSVAISVVVIFQALLGMWTVTLMLMPIIVMGHLLGGFTLFCSLCLVYWQLTHSQKGKDAYELDVNHSQQTSISTSLKSLALLSLIVVIIQIALGGWTSSNYAALMCTSLPICQGDWMSYLDFRQAFDMIQPEKSTYEFGTLDYGARMTIHVTHRLGALLTVLVVGALIVQLYRHPSSVYKTMARRLAWLLSAQVLLGLSNILLSLPLLVAVAHNLGAALLLITILYINVLIWRSVPSPTDSTHILSKESTR
ncbi:heme A synthase [Vibrio sinensis]|uniref:Heme A synthase n=1 Tax=Vibrio sinensis TaxID=2302434 RepID=A0A3A6QSD0_9VIBR|nr:COX15/CtaA family protein [Vibrio sinensis]RJX70971.1 heme A synthase [Vibrio sinensis]